MALPDTTRIAIQSEGIPGRPRKLLQIKAYGAGGFAVLVPYHKSRDGYLAKMPVDYKTPGERIIPWSEVIHYTAHDRVKLSYHPDGFVQFSGENQGKILSGRTPDGEIRGLGLLTHPLSNPVRSGPTFGVIGFGLEDFDEISPADKNVICFDDDDLYYLGTSPEEANAWDFEAFVLPGGYWSGVRRTKDGYSISLVLPSFYAAGAVFTLKVIRLQDQPWFLAAMVNRVKVNFDPAPSGWTLAGPGEYDSETGEGHTLNAFYPNIFPIPSATSLDYSASGPTSP